MNNKTIAIIGCGAAAVVLIRSFIKKYNAQQVNTNIKIIIFESGFIPGVGLAYQNDLDNLLINRPAQTMSANIEQPEEFFEWLKNTNNSWCDKSNMKESQFIYPSRKIFGHYLTEVLGKSISEASRLGINITFIKDTVEKFIKDNTVCIKTKNSGVFFADYILISTGNNQPNDFYNLNETPKYINSPHPLYKNLSAIGSSETVGIIGNSLTAVDIAIGLDYLRHNSAITMLSRLYINPRVRDKISISHKLKFFTSLAIIQVKQEKHKLTLKDVLRVFRRELKHHDIPWKKFFIEDNKAITLNELIFSELEEAKYDRKWQSILSATNEVIENIWHELDHESKSAFIKYYQRFWLTNRSPIPQINARLLLKLGQQEKLFSVSGLDSLVYDSKTNKYIATTKNNRLAFDWIINATGPARYVQSEHGLLHNLIKDGIARHHPFGGIDVDFDTSAIINNQGHMDLNIRVIGHNTIGVYNYTSSLEMIAKKADKIASDFIDLIKEEKLNGQDKMVNVTAFNRIGYVAQNIN